MITINHGDQVVTLEEIRVTKPNTAEGTGTIKLVFVDERGRVECSPSVPLSRAISEGAIDVVKAVELSEAIFNEAIGGE